MKRVPSTRASSFLPYCILKPLVQVHHQGSLLSTISPIHSILKSFGWREHTAVKTRENRTLHHMAQSWECKRNKVSGSGYKRTSHVMGYEKKQKLYPKKAWAGQGQTLVHVLFGQCIEFISHRSCSKKKKIFRHIC